MREINIDIERLRQDLIDYFGSAIPIYPVAIMDVTVVETANDDKLIEIAKINGFNLNYYIVELYTRNLFK